MLKPEHFTTEFGKRIFREYFGFLIPEEESPQIEAPPPANTITVNPPANQATKQEEQKKEFNPFQTETLLPEQQTIDAKVDETIEPTTFARPKPTFDYRITPYTITRHLCNNRVVGEEANGCLITIALANGMHVIFEGESGTGKSYVMGTILKLFDDVYQLGLASGQAVWYQADEINKSRIIYMPELQKAVADRSNRVSGIIEFMKSMGEGKDVTRTTTNKTRNGVDVYTVKSGKTMVSTIAKENAFKYDRELQRRFLILETDNSQQHIEDIVKDKVARKVNVDVSNGKATIEKRLSDRARYVMDMEEVYVINPFLGYLEQAFPIMKKVQSYLDHYLNLFDAWGKFFSPERTSMEINRRTFVMLNLEDVYNVFSMYHSHFLRTLQSFNMDEDVPNFEPDWAECFRHGVYTAKEGLTVKFDNGTVNLGKEYPELIEEWVNSQLHGSKVYAIDYKTGQKVEIADMKKREAPVEEAAALDGSPYQTLYDVSSTPCTAVVKYIPPLIVTPRRMLPLPK